MPSVTAFDDPYATFYAQPLTVAASGVLSNDLGSPLTAALATPAARGTVSLNANGGFNYTQTDFNFLGLDTFTYQATDGVTSATAVANIQILAAPTTTSLSASASSLFQGQAVTFTATVARAQPSPGAPIPSGSITFKDGSTVLAVVALDGSGWASFATTALAVGGHSITAEYAASGGYAASASAPVSVQVNAAILQTIGAQTWEHNAGVWLEVPVANPNNLTLTFSASGLPSSLSIDAGTGLITGTPATWSSGSATISVATSQGTDTESFAWAVVSAPVVTMPGEQWTNLNAALVFSTAQSNTISVASGYGSSTVLKLALEVNDGTLTLGTTTGLTFLTGDGTGDSAMSFTGTVTALNAALNGLSFAPNTGYRGEALIGVTVTDQNHLDGSGVPLTAYEEVGVAVGGPVVLVPATQSTNSSQPLVFSWHSGNGIYIIDPPASAAGLRMDLTTSNGTLTLGSTSGLTFTTGDGASDSAMSFSGLLDNINRALEGLTYTPSTNYVGDATIVIEAIDQGIAWGTSFATGTGQVTVHVGGPSVAVPGNQWTNANTSKAFSSANGNAITVDNQSGSSSNLDITLSGGNGTLTLASLAGLTFTAGDGTTDAVMAFSGSAGNINAALNGLTFAPTADFLGAASLFISADEAGSAYPQTAYNGVNIVVGGPVVALGDAAETILDQAVTVAALDNDTSVATGPLIITIVTNPANGTVAVNHDSTNAVPDTITYTPSIGYSGSDSFTYRITDSANNTATATVSIVVFALQAVGDSVAVDMNTPETIAVLSNDIGASSIVSVTGASNGTVAISGTSIVYTPNTGFTGPDLFGYTIADANGHTSSTTVEIGVSDPNAPVNTITAGNDTAATATGTPITINVLDNDRYYVGNPYNVTAPAHGNAVVNGNGNVVYTPTAGYNGTDSFNYTIADGNNNTANATVNITVQSEVVLIDINDTAEHSDDVAFTGKPMAARITLLAPSLSGPQSITLKAQNPDGTTSSRAVIVTDPTQTASQGVTELTLNNVTIGVPSAVWLIATQSSAASDDIVLAAFMGADKMGEQKEVAVTVTLGSGGTKDPTTGAIPTVANKIYNMVTTPQAMVDANKYRIPPRTWSLIYLSVDVAQNVLQGKTFYVKVLNQSADNGKVEFANGNYPANKQTFSELKVSGTSSENDENKWFGNFLFAWVRGTVTNNTADQTNPGVNNVNVGKLVMIVANKQADLTPANKGAESLGFSVSAIITKVEMKKNPTVYGEFERVKFSNGQYKGQTGYKYHWGQKFDVMYHSDSMVWNDLNMVKVTEMIVPIALEGYWNGRPGETSEYETAFRSDWAFQYTSADYHTVDYGYSDAKMMMIDKVGKGDPVKFRPEALKDAISEINISGVYQVDQYFKFYDMRTGMTAQAAVEVAESGFTIRLAKSNGKFFVTKRASANNQVLAGTISAADSRPTEVEFK